MQNQWKDFRVGNCHSVRGSEEALSLFKSFFLNNNFSGMVLSLLVLFPILLCLSFLKEVAFCFSFVKLIWVEFFILMFCFHLWMKSRSVRNRGSSWLERYHYIYTIILIHFSRSSFNVICWNPSLLGDYQVPWFYI